MRGKRLEYSKNPNLPDGMNEKNVFNDVGFFQIWTYFSSHLSLIS